MRAHSLITCYLCRLALACLVMGIAMGSRADHHGAHSAPEFTGQTLAGETISLEQFRGQPVTLVFLDSLCPMPQFPDCEAKIAAFKEAATQKPDHQWLGIASSFYVDKAYVEAFKEKFGIRIPIIFDADNKIFNQYAVYESPYFIELDAQGKVVKRGDKPM